MAKEIPLVPRSEAIVRNLDPESLRDLMSRGLDYGCRPWIERAEDGSYALVVTVVTEQVEELRRDGFELELLPAPDYSIYEVGEGDRFAGGEVAPRGLGEKVMEPSWESERS